MAKVSVIIPTYNGAKYLATAVESALAQTYRDVEVVIVNDGSTDGTDAIARAYGPRVTYIRKTENTGLASARNVGIRGSSGTCIALLDDDDWWEPEKLQEQMAEIEKDGAVALVYSDMCVHYDDGSTIPSFLSSRPLASSGYVFDKLIQSRFIFPSTVLIRRSCLQQVGLFDESMLSLEDCEFFSRLCYACRVAVVRKPLVHRRQRAGNMTSDEDLGTRYRIKFHEKALLLPNLSPGRTRELWHQLSAAYFKRGTYCLGQRRMDECRDSLRLSLRHDWSNHGALRCLMGSYLSPKLLAQARRWRNWLQGNRLAPQSDVASSGD